MRARLTLRNAALCLLLLWAAVMSLRSLTMQRRLTVIENVVLRQDKLITQSDVRAAAALEIASDALHVAGNKKITPPIKPRKESKQP